jgi:hypothetical protein
MSDLSGFELIKLMNRFGTVFGTPNGGLRNISTTYSDPDGAIEFRRRLVPACQCILEHTARMPYRNPQAEVLRNDSLVDILALRLQGSPQNGEDERPLFQESQDAAQARIWILLARDFLERHFSEFVNILPYFEPHVSQEYAATSRERGMDQLRNLVYDGIDTHAIASFQEVVGQEMRAFIPQLVVCTPEGGFSSHDLDAICDMFEGLPSEEVRTSLGTSSIPDRAREDQYPPLGFGNDDVSR